MTWEVSHPAGQIIQGLVFGKIELEQLENSIESYQLQKLRLLEEHRAETGQSRSYCPSNTSTK
jgi:hypothetical protein